MNLVSAMTRGKLLLVDVFSYSCMNCLRSLRYIRKLDRRYRSRGLMTIVLHTPEWEFEKDKEGVTNACKRLGVSYPVILDSKKEIIGKLGIDFWPTQLLMKDGKILYCHVGEGKYGALEKTIRTVLDSTGKWVFASEPKYTKYPAVYAGTRKGRKITNGNAMGFGKMGIIKGKFTQGKEALNHQGEEGIISLVSKGGSISIIAQSSAKKGAAITIKENNKIHDRVKVKEPMLYAVKPFPSQKQRRLIIEIKGRMSLYSFGFA